MHVMVGGLVMGRDYHPSECHGDEWEFERCWELSSVFFSSRRRHTRFDCDWSSDVCSSDLENLPVRDALIDLQLSDESAINEHKEETASALHAQGIEDDASVFVQLNQRTISSILRRISGKRCNILLRNPWHLFNGHVFARYLAAN